MSAPQIRVETLCADYRVRELSESDVPEVLKLYKGNPIYFEHCPPAPSEDSVREDMHALPNGKTVRDKYFVGFFRGETLAAVMDLISGHPDDKTAFIGLFMVTKEFQGFGTGTDIISDCLRTLKFSGFKRVRLAYVTTNMQAKMFWLKNDFCPTGAEYKNELYTAAVMEKVL